MNEQNRMREQQFIKQSKERHNHVFATEEAKEAEKGFNDVLIKEYMKILNIDKLCSFYYISPYIPISKLRKKIRKQLNISDKDFDKQFLEVKRETSEYLIHLTQPMLRGSGGVRINGRYYHFIGIFKKGEKRQNESLCGYY